MAENTIGFDVTSLDSPVKGKFFLDASAGTGKTFAIENIVLRLVLSGDISSLDKILVMTFTRAATEELKSRIKDTLLSAKSALKLYLDDRESSLESLPYYLSPEMHPEKVKQLYIRVRLAISTLENASIYTIHGFCRKVLDEYSPGFQIPTPPPGMTRSQSFQEVISHYLSQDLWKDILFPQQFHFIAYQHNPNKPGSIGLIEKLKSSLETKNLEPLSKEYFFERAKHYSSSLQPLIRLPRKGLRAHLEHARQNLKKDIPITEHDVEAFLDSLYSLHHLQESSNYSLEDSAPSIFLHYRVALAFLNNIKQSAQKILNCPVFSLLRTSGLLSDIILFFHEERLLATLAMDIRKHLESTFGPCLSFDDLVSTVENILCSNTEKASQIRNTIRNQYELVLIDESQDTDKAQWNIFQSLFLSEEYSGNLFIIGDPKQSIYEWRKADLSSYLNIRDSFPPNSILQMNTNYRSTPDLMQSINLFFSLRKPFLTILSEQNSSPKTLDYHHCLSGKNSLLPPLTPRKPIHFFLSETLEDAISNICQEALRLHEEHKVPFGDMAVLVSQNEHAFTFIRTSSLPTSLCKSKSIFSKTPSHTLLLLLLEILKDPCNANKVAAILSSCLFGYTSSEIQRKLESEIEFFVELSEYVKTRKLLSTFYKLMSRCGVSLLSTTTEGSLIYQEMELLCIYLEKQTPNPAQYLIYLKDLEELKEREEELLINFSSEDKETLKVTTIHSSKGLEYEVVFLLGLFSSTKKSITESIHETYVAVTRARRQVYIPINTKTKSSLFHNYIKEITSESAESFAQNLSQNHSESFSFSEKMQYQTKERNQPKGNDSSLAAPHPFSLPHIEISEVLSFSKVYENLYPYPASTNKDENIPRGRAFGILVHEILEKLDFSLFIDAKTEDKIRLALEPFIKTFTKNTPFQEHNTFIARIIAKAFSTPLSFKTNTFQLSEVDPQKIFREEDFLTKDDNNTWKGVIDLFFEHQGSYYLIDWKTTTLESYSQENLSEYVKQNNFDKQAEIYLTATKNFLKQFDIQTSPEIAFIFLKGLDQDGQGVFIP
ncbi:UvrD-helicase domain-containing protein [Chlamydiifrater phoenicopteri]|uniref:UvrD-helicase domain-containing protein n=1 Tax=Chlamydiifrater phoenicopteri TaxID=2681469 RepID=UPI001BCFAA88|nr:UvrD-helicase domain-containing protein [Chlamydiifrater phoenicopteri]